MPQPDDDTPPPRPAALPLHKQLRDLMTARIASGEWSPGTYLPPETRLAQDYGVAIGTLRKALLDMAAAGLVVRRQGKGTVVASHDSDAALFRFFSLRRPDGSTLRPESRELGRARRPATAPEAQALGLAPDGAGDPDAPAAPGADVICITRVRDADGVPVVFERIVLDAARFGALADRPGPLPNTLYRLYQTDFAASVHRAQDRIIADGAPGDCAAALGLPQGAPVLRVDRVALDYAGAPIELRLSWVHTAALHYAVTL